NNYCAPPVHLVCYRQEHQGRSFIVIVVSEFHDIPVICTKQFEVPSPAPGRSPKVLLKKAAIYHRTANAESAPLSSAEEVRQLIGLATTKRADQMLAMFQAMLKGRPLVSEQPDEDRFGAEREQVRADLDQVLEGKIGQGAWTFLCHLTRYQANRWEETDKLR